ncbi:helix-turn-helix domain-containing protein [Paraglaciecola sp. 20A4]|uniref:helix-turn-helix domain-containing protein n=1 Tax=Paraglaciecola sp. 20A4 TaxID=2687288 RepID=UPI00140B7CE9|nr:helix-turn-helix domain-containing protein [Paraglaciecola sp. 20A4]
MRIRLMALSHIKNGANRTQTAQYLHVSRRMVNEWVKRFNAHGLDGLKEKRVLAALGHCLLSSWNNLKRMWCLMPSNLMEEG